jgi:hypothetical protein
VKEPMPVTVAYPWTDRERATPVTDVRAAAQCFPGEPMRVRIGPAEYTAACGTEEVLDEFERVCREPNARNGWLPFDMARLWGMPVEVSADAPRGRVGVGPNAVLVGVLPG